MIILFAGLMLYGAFETGVHAEKSAAVGEKKICFDQAYQSQKVGCYTVVPPKEEELD